MPVMSWNKTLTVVRDTPLVELERAGVYIADDLPTGADAAQQDVLGGIQDGPNAVLTGVGEDSADDLARRIVEACGCEVVVAYFGDATESFGWSVHSRSGQRLWSWRAGQVVVDEGAPLPEESEAGEVLDADGLFRMIEKRTGLGNWMAHPAYRLEQRRQP